MATSKVEAQIKNEKKRRLIIESILSQDNLDRKQEARRRFDIYKDNVVHYVKKALKREVKDHTAEEMMNRATNVNVAKQIVDKLARIYESDIKRSVPADTQAQTKIEKILAAFRMVVGKIKGAAVTPEEKTAQIQAIEKGFDINPLMKKASKWLRLHRNCYLRVVPIPDREDEKKRTLRLDLLHPGQYDVIEDPDEPTKAACVIFSSGVNDEPNEVSITGFKGQRNGRGFDGGNQDQKDAIRIEDQTSSEASLVAAVGPTEKQLEDMRFIWWTDKSHFTTNGKGEIQENPDNPKNLNPIGILPGVELNMDQDGRFWSRGGQDLIDACILLNIQLTDLNYILFLQGMGILYAIGPDIPKVFKAGPNHVLAIKTSSGAPADSNKIGFASSEPPVEGHLANIEQQLALVLSSNGLETSSVATKLQADQAASGIHLAIQMSKATGSIKDEEPFWQGVEVRLFQVIARWFNFLIEKGLAVDSIKNVGSMSDKIQVLTEFKAPAPYFSEKETLEILELKKKLGFWELWELIKMARPQLSDEEAKEMATTIEAKAMEQQALISGQPAAGEDDDGKTPEGEDGKKPQPKPGEKPQPKPKPVPDEKKKPGEKE